MIGSLQNVNMEENGKDTLDRAQNKRGRTGTCTRRKIFVENTEIKAEEMTRQIVIKVTRFYVQFLPFFMFCNISQFRTMFYVHRSPHSQICRLNAVTAILQSPKSCFNGFL